MTSRDPSRPHRMNRERLEKEKISTNKQKRMKKALEIFAQRIFPISETYPVSLDNPSPPSGWENLTVCANPNYKSIVKAIGDEYPSDDESDYPRDISKTIREQCSKYYSDDNYFDHMKRWRHFRYALHSFGRIVQRSPFLLLSLTCTLTV